jgi:glycogen debranching enzyme
MAYHNGSVWPHDSAMIAAGLARYGLTDLAVRILTGLYDAGRYEHGYRLPELFCGFARREGEGPTAFPLACEPQSWASGAVFLMLQAVLGASILGAEGRVVFRSPRLPEFVERLEIFDLKIGERSLDLSLRRRGREVEVDVPRKDGDLEVVVVK